MKRSRPCIRGVTVAAALLAPLAANAHLVSTGLGPFYDGLSHFLLSPEDVLPALALALLVGLNGAAIGRVALFALSAAWCAGGLVGVAWPTIDSGSALTILSFLALGGMAAADTRLQPRGAIALAVVVGLLYGYENGSAMAEARLGLLGLAGVVSTLFVTVALTAALVVALRAPWARVAVRVAGSWIAAAGLLMWGWSLHAT